VLSSSTLSIAWHQPDLTDEQWEFTHHPAKQSFYQRHTISWQSLCAAFDAGVLTPYPRSPQLNGCLVELSYSSYDDYAFYLAKAKRGYRRNYANMEETLQRDGMLRLPAPIIVQAGQQALLYSGYRRLCLAWNYGMTPAVWLVKIPQGGEVCTFS